MLAMENPNIGTAVLFLWKLIENQLCFESSFCFVKWFYSVNIVYTWCAYDLIITLINIRENLVLKSRQLSEISFIY